MCKRTVRLTGSLIVVLSLYGCATTKGGYVNVLPRGNGQYQVIARNHNSASAQNAAIKEATSFCKKMDKNIIFGQGNGSFVQQKNVAAQDYLKGISNTSLVVKKVGDPTDDAAAQALQSAGYGEEDSGQNFQYQYNFTCQ